MLRLLYLCPVECMGGIWGAYPGCMGLVPKNSGDQFTCLGNENMQAKLLDDSVNPKRKVKCVKRFSSRKTRLGDEQ